MSGSFKVKLDISKFEAQLAALATDIKGEGGRKAVETGGSILQGMIKAAAPKGTTGHLADSVKLYTAVPTGSGWQISTGPTAVYAKMREFGGSIRPKNGKRLKFVAGGGEHFPKSVHQRGTHYVKNAAEFAPGPVRAAVIGTLDEVIKGVTG